MPVPEDAVAAQGRWIEAWRARLSADAGHPVDLIETHISWVLIDGDRAYKLKKALRNGFIDAGTLALRRHHCEEELRLNRRLAPSIYLGVGALCGSPLAPVLVMMPPVPEGASAALAQPALASPGSASPGSASPGGASAGIAHPGHASIGRASQAHASPDEPADLHEWVVVMRAFDRRDVWDALAARGELGAAQVDDLARSLAAFQDRAAVALPGGPYGTPERVQADWAETLDALQAGLDPADAPAQADLLALRAGLARIGPRLALLAQDRLDAGRVREGHGDLHLGNVLSLDGRATVFDGIDFNPGLRWIDTASEAAFMAMDLAAHGLHGLGHRFVNAWLEAGGDYAAVPLLDTYQAYRAAVRAKVALMRARQAGASGGPPASGRQGHDAAARHEAGTAIAPIGPSRSDPPQGDRSHGDPSHGDRSHLGFVHVDLAHLDLARRYLAQARELLAPGPQRAAGGPARMAPALLITHGPSGSGKTTLTQGLIEQGGVIRIRSDVERRRGTGLGPTQASGSPLHGGLYAEAMQEALLQRMLVLARSVIEGGRAVVLDATFLRHGAREAARALAIELGVPFRILHLSASDAVLRERVRERARRGGDASEADAAVLDEQLRSAQALRPSEWAVAHAVQALPAPPGEPPRADWTALIAQLQGPAAAGPKRRTLPQRDSGDGVAPPSP